MYENPANRRLLCVTLTVWVALLSLWQAEVLLRRSQAFAWKTLLREMQRQGVALMNWYLTDAFGTSLHHFDVAMLRLNLAEAIEKWLSSHRVESTACAATNGLPEAIGPQSQQSNATGANDAT